MSTQTQTQQKTTLSTSHDSSYVPRGPVKATLSFYQAPEDGSIPWNYVEVPKEGPQRNFGVDNVEVEINDIRGHESDFYLDKDAFQTVSGVSSEEKDFTDDEHIKSVYYPEVEKGSLRERSRSTQSHHLRSYSTSLEPGRTPRTRHSCTR